MARMRQVRQRLNFSPGDEDHSFRGTEEELRCLPCNTTCEEFLRNGPEFESLNEDFLSSIKSPALPLADLRDTEMLRSSSPISHRDTFPSRQCLTSIRCFRKSYNVINILHATVLCMYSFIRDMAIARLLFIPKYFLFVFQFKMDHSVQKRESLQSSVTPKSEIKRWGININPFTPESILVQTKSAKRNRRNRVRQGE